MDIQVHLVNVIKFSPAHSDPIMWCLLYTETSMNENKNVIFCFSRWNLDMSFAASEPSFGLFFLFRLGIHDGRGRGLHSGR